MLNKKSNKKKEVERDTVLLRAEDDCFKRAEKLLSLTGLANPGRLADSMARGVHAYMELDKKTKNETKDVE